MSKRLAKSGPAAGPDATTSATSATSGYLGYLGRSGYFGVKGS
ncbi:hypothetical protein [Streptomyces venezuelae]|nr:hypothetical protein [Streptomyces venezuelae]